VPRAASVSDREAGLVVGYVEMQGLIELIGRAAAMEILLEAGS